MKKNISSCLLFLLPFLTWSQQTSEEIFSEARELAREKNYGVAIEKLEQLQKKHPENYDYSIYLARVYFWNKEYKKAQDILAPQAEKDPPNQEVFKLSLQIDLAAENTSAIINKSEKGIQYFPEDKADYLFYRALGFQQNQDFNAAIKSLNKIPEDAANRADTDYLKNKLLQSSKKNSISVGYLNTAFPTMAPWHLAHLEYNRKNNTLPFTLRANFGHVFENEGGQFEIDAYPKLGKSGYFYLNAGIATHTRVFPELRFGGEYFQGFGKYTTSLGLRYLKFEVDDVTMFTGSLTRNFNNFQAGYRIFLVSEKNDWFPSHNLHLRKNFIKREGHIQLDIQYGRISYFYVLTETLSQVNSYRAGFTIKFRLGDNFFIQPMLMYEREEYTPDKFRNRFNTQLILSQRF